MDTNSNINRPPQGRLPQQVYYQRRRVAAVVVLVVLALLIVWILSSLGGNNNQDNTAQVAETTTQQTTSVATSAAPSEEVSAAPASEELPPSEEAPSSEAPKDSCTVADLIVEASTDQPNYGEGILPTFYMTIKNPTAVDCVIDFSEFTPRFEVYNLQNNQRLWSDIDCNDSVGVGDQTIPPGEERFYQATWSRTTSGPEQCDARQRVEPGSFYLHTVVGDNASQPATFNLR